MAKKSKPTMKELDLREVVAGVQQATISIGMYAENKEQLQKVLAHPDFTEKLFAAFSDLQAFSAELSKRFNAPVHYEAEERATA